MSNAIPTSRKADKNEGAGIPDERIMEVAKLFNKATVPIKDRYVLIWIPSWRHPIRKLTFMWRLLK